MLDKIKQLIVKGHSVVISATGIAMGNTKVSGMAAPTVAGDALVKGTRVTTAELPAMTDEKIWKGTGGNVEEVDAPTNTELQGVKVSNTLRNSNDTERTDYYEVYTKLKEVLLNADLPFCRLKFDLKSETATNDAFGRVYKNGVAIGTEQTNNTETYVTKSQDFAGWVSGDLIQIYCYAGYLIGYSVRNMRFHYDPDDEITHLHGTELTTPLSLVTTRDPTISVTNQDP